MKKIVLMSKIFSIHNVTEPAIVLKAILISEEMFHEPLQIGVNELMQCGYMELRLIIEWARKVPGQWLGGGGEALGGYIIGGYYEASYGCKLDVIVANRTVCGF